MMPKDGGPIIQSIMRYKNTFVDRVVDAKSGKVVMEIFKGSDGVLSVEKVREFGVVDGRDVCTRITFRLYELPKGAELPKLMWVEELDVLTNTMRKFTPEEYRRARGSLKDIPETHTEAYTLAKTIRTKRSQLSRLEKEIAGLEARLDIALKGKPFDEEGEPK